MELAELLSKAEGADADWLREGVRVLAQALMDTEVSAQIGAARTAAWPTRRQCRRSVPKQGVRRTSADSAAAMSSVD
jgi:transposase-like protein